MSYNSGSNPAWQRNLQGNLTNLANQLMRAQGNFTGDGLPFQQSPQQANQFGSHSQMNQGQAMFSQQQQSIQYPVPHSKRLNPLAFQNPPPSNIRQPAPSTVINSMGTVTKLNNEGGLINDEIYFHFNVCRDGNPRIGDRLMYEADYSPNTQYKWICKYTQDVLQKARNVTKSIQPPPLMAQSVKVGSGYNAVPPCYSGDMQVRRPVSPRRSPERISSRDRKEPRRSREREEDIERKRRREEREKSRERRDRERERREPSAEKRDRERSPIRRSSPKRKRPRAIPRYCVQIPKTILAAASADVFELRRRYNSLYIPSDFFHTEIKWPEAFGLSNQFSLNRPCTFHIMKKTVDTPTLDQSSLVEPDDVDYLFCAKVMLLGCPPISEIYQKCLHGNDRDDDFGGVHPTRLINFLVGTRGRNEPMAIGGPWSPSIDGEHPESDPAVLIRTAIRTCRALTGIDLSNCTQWYRFVELYYHRAEHTHKGKVIPARVETVVIFLPDIHSLVPTHTEWDGLKLTYKTAMDQALNGVRDDSSALANDSSGDLNSDGVGTTAAAADGTETMEADVEVKRKPTHYSDLDVKNMKAQDLRDELTARNLSAKGLRPQLAARLTKAINSEKAAEQGADMDDSKSNLEDVQADVDMEDAVEVDMSDILILDETDEAKNVDEDAEKGQGRPLTEKERQQLERSYKLPDMPHVIVHPSKTAKSGKFDCVVMSLSVLLDYRQEDTKERSFEVSLFAELFNEMLMRDSIFNIFKALALAKDKSPVVEKSDQIKETKEGGEKSKEKVEESKSNGAGTGENEKIETEKNGGDRKSSASRERKHSKREEENEDDNFSIKSGEKRRRTEKKMVLAKPDLLLSFVYFDTTHCGYIFEKDLEELFQAIGLNLSRRQVKAILAKSVSRESLYYRKLTDKEEGDKSENEESEEVSDEVLQILKGNLHLLPLFNKPLKAENSQEQVESNDGSGLVMFNGCLVDVGKVMDQMKRSEQARLEMEKNLMEVRKKCSDLQNVSNKATNKIKDLQSEVKSLTRKLTDTDKDLLSLNRKYNDQHAILSSVYEKVAPVFARHEKEKSRKTRSRSRDKSKDRKERDPKEKDTKDKSKEKDKTRKDEKEKKAVKDNEKDEKEKKENKEQNNVDGENIEGVGDVQNHTDEKADDVREEQETNIQDESMSKNIGEE